MLLGQGCERCLINNVAIAHLIEEKCVSLRQGQERGLRAAQPFASSGLFELISAESTAGSPCDARFVEYLSKNGLERDRVGLNARDFLLIELRSSGLNNRLRLRDRNATSRLRRQNGR